MEIAELIAPSRVISRARCSSKKRLLEYVSVAFSRSVPGLTRDGVFETLIRRERLGSTAVGHGAAIPHGRTAETDRILGLFLRLEDGVDFDAPDQEHVDLVFAVLLPEKAQAEHREVLNHLARMFRDPRFCRDLRAAPRAQDLHFMLDDWQPAGVGT